MDFVYTNENFILRSTNTLSEFDETLHTLWTSAYEANRFRYKIDISMRSIKKITSGSVDILILPNDNRFNHRRKPQSFSSINDKLLPESFNFNKVPAHEFLLHVFEKDSTKSCSILINVSPFSYFHSLLVPEVKMCYNQFLRKDSFYSAIKCFLLSSNRYLCMGFNSLLAHASVNHLHFHFWQSPEYLRAMSIDIKLKYENSFYYELIDHPVDNFVLELTNLTELDQFVNRLWMVISSCQDLQIAHNVFAGRSKSSGYVRVVIWPRCSVYEVKNLFTADSEAGYYVAVAELAGMVVASENYAGTLSYDKVESLLYNERLPRSIFHTLECKLHETLSTE
ncbi:GDP-L-galactose phosphorylase 2 [Schistosoma japonicum]|nr:GDP-L-galactose phosphorylase 2 [Schistosoma japonicum]KAH8850056.1 GDP-L-galactose phosphorylase 2 [Schistosoma japonicum]KAH8850057.1 GDP-L-galactose phosphorylase 2 [Schistosoma japonicum]